MAAALLDQDDERHGNVVFHVRPATEAHVASRVALTLTGDRVVERASYKAAQWASEAGVVPTHEYVQIGISIPAPADGIQPQAERRRWIQPQAEMRLASVDAAPTTDGYEREDCAATELDEDEE